jgi:hypothetical protein
MNGKCDRCWKNLWALEPETELESCPHCGAPVLEEDTEMSPESLFKFLPIYLALGFVVTFLIAGKNIKKNDSSLEAELPWIVLNTCIFLVPIAPMYWRARKAIWKKAAAEKCKQRRNQRKDRKQRTNQRKDRKTRAKQRRKRK